MQYGRVELRKSIENSNSSSKQYFDKLKEMLLRRRIKDDPRLCGLTAAFIYVPLILQVKCVFFVVAAVCGFYC